MNPNRGVKMTQEENQELNQRAFTTMVKHLRQQGVRSVDPEDSQETCLYRGPNGTKCAVGCLIAEEHYDSNFENKVSWGMTVVEALDKSGWKGLSEDLTSAMQSIHDGKRPEVWEDHFLKVADRFSYLTVPEQDDPSVS
jgi:hypothetical protein